MYITISPQKLGDAFSQSAGDFVELPGKRKPGEKPAWKRNISLISMKIKYGRMK